MRRVKIGVIGCGAIAQVHHMPNLHELYDYFEVGAVCDVSAGAAEFVAKKFGVPRHFTDYRDLLATDVEAVLLCQTDPKTEVAVAALEAGKHAFIEKPVCFSLQALDKILAAQARSGKIAQAGYMKVYDPAYEYAKREIETMQNIRFVQVNHLHPNNDLHMRQFDIKRFDDLPPNAINEARTARSQELQEAIGDAPKHVEGTFYLLSGSMIHDIYSMRAALGIPNKVVSSEIWFDGRAVTMTLEYPQGFRNVASWIDLPDLWDFTETLEVYGDNKRVIVQYPTGFSRVVLATVTIQGVDDKGTTYRQEPAIDWESAFCRELRHFHDCIVNGATCRTPLAEARLDISLIIDVIKAYQTRQVLER